MPLTRAHLEALKTDLARLTPENCKDVFPTQDRFFFGAQEYNNYY
jgi:hypothetical protein